MKKGLALIVILFLGINLFGCGRKEAALEEGQEQMTIEGLATVNATMPLAPEVKVSRATPISQAQLEPLPPAGPYKPTAVEIQTAIKNAGFYSGEVDGKIGPKTKKAIKDFQEANSLQADGKVGPKTWAALEKYLNPAPVETAPRKKR